MLRRKNLWKREVTTLEGKTLEEGSRKGRLEEWKRALLSEAYGVNGAREAETTASQV